MGFVDHSGAHLAAGDKPLDIKWPVRWCGHPAFVSVPSSGQRCPNWHRAHRTGEVGIAGDGATGPGTSCAVSEPGGIFDSYLLSKLLAVPYSALPLQPDIRIPLTSSRMHT